MSKNTYPLEVASIVRKQTFYIESHLGMADVNSGEKPFHVYNKFSRFVACIINENRKAATANIPVSEMIHIIRKAKYAEMREYMSTAFGKQDSEGHPGYTVRFLAGELKGKTPAEILLEQGEKGIAVLQEQLNYLKRNVERYPNNAKVIEAIRDAAGLYRAGKLDEHANQRGVIELYKAEMRPLRSRVRQDGKTFVYNISINWIPGNQYPVEVKITNYYAPVTKLEDGRLNVQVKQRDPQSVICNTMVISGNELMEMLYAVQTNMRQFEMIHAQELWKQAESTYQAQRNSAVKSQNVQNYQAEINSGMSYGANPYMVYTQANGYYSLPTTS